MKADIHPTWYSKAVVKCACGANFTVGSTQPQIHVEVCSNCHPFYTGKAKYIDTMGRVERFQQRKSAVKVTKKDKKGEGFPAGGETPHKTLKEIMAEIKASKSE